MICLLNIHIHRLIILCAALSSLVFCQNLFSQNIIAKYRATMQINVVHEDGVKPKLPELEFDCYYYKKGNRYISFLRPLYFEKYKQGFMNYDVPNSAINHFAVYHLNMDTLIAASYKDTDSLIWRSTHYSNMSNNQKPDYYNYERGWQQWNILPEKRNIDGLECQRAELVYSGGMYQEPKKGWDVWFCPDIPVGANISNVLELPGLVIEGEDLVLGIRYELESYALNVAIDDKVFWPDVFNKKFAFRGNLKLKTN